MRRTIRCLTTGGISLWASVVSAGPPPATDTTDQSQPVEEIIVKAPRRGYRSDNITNVGPFKDLRLQDAPYSIGITPGALIENRAAHTVSDALLTNPAVAALSESNSYSSASRVLIRGFIAGDQGDMRDGIVDRSFTHVPLENVARIEVQNGLSSFLYGFGAVGGTVNYVSKQPSVNRRVDVTVGDYGGGIAYGQIGATGPLTGDKALTGRIDLYREDGTTNIDGGAQNRTLGSGVLSYRFDKDTVVKLDFLHQDYSVAGLKTYFAPVYFNGRAYIPPAPDSTRQYGQPYTHNESERDLGGAAVEAPLGDAFNLRVAYRYGQMSRRFNYIDAQFTGLPGIYQETFVDTPRQDEQTHAGYALLDTEFDTWSVKHKLTFGSTASYFDLHRGANQQDLIGLSSIGNPVYIPRPRYAPLDRNPREQSQLLTNCLVGDRIEVDAQWAALVGVDYARIEQNGGAGTRGFIGADFSVGRASPSASLVYKPIPTLSLYATYMQGLVTGGEAPDVYTFNNITKRVVNAGAILPPRVSDQYEVGAKATVGSMFLTASLFRIEKVNEGVDQTDFVYRQEGQEIHQGLEFTATGKLTGRLTAVGGFTIMQARIENAPQNLDLNGKIPVNVPERQARAYFEYLIPEVDGLTGSLGVNYLGGRPVDQLNTAFLHDAVIVDLGMRYQTVLFGRDTTFNLRVSNLLDTSYWSYVRTGDGMLLGAPRTVAGFMKVSF
jgi:iron complex outermembrane receptor protein